MNSQVLYKDIVDVCKTIYDPEIPQNIWDLGLVYSVDIDDDKNVDYASGRWNDRVHLHLNAMMHLIHGPSTSLPHQPLPGD